MLKLHNRKNDIDLVLVERGQIVGVNMIEDKSQIQKGAIVNILPNQITEVKKVVVQMRTKRKEDNMKI